MSNIIARTYKVEKKINGTWQTIYDARSFELVQLRTASETAAWEHARWSSNWQRLQELAQALLDYWNSQQPEKWRYTLN